MVRDLRSILLLPGIVLVIFPAIILTVSNNGSVNWVGRDWLKPVLSIFRTIVIASGLYLLVSAIIDFVRYGEGTLAPWDETQNLVVQELYRYVRNPMITGVILILFGEVLIFRSIYLFAWGAVFLIGNIIYIPFSEERGLVSRFGDE